MEIRIIGALVAALAVACGQAAAEGNATPSGSASARTPKTAPLVRATRVEVATLSTDDAAQDLELPAEVEALRDAQLGAAMGGYVEALTVKSGDRVKAGQLLATVDSATHHARVRAIEVELKAAERELARAKALGDVIPAAQLDDATTRVEAARAELTSARIAAQRSTITAPFAGEVVSVDAEVGEIAAPGVPMLRLVAIDRVKVSATVSDREMSVITAGSPAVVRIDALPRPLPATVTRVLRAADLGSRAFIVELELPNDDRTLLPGMIASVRIPVKLQPGQVVIHQDWVVTSGETTGVFLDEGGVARWREITLGTVLRDRVVVTAGLQPGVRLVITGHRELADGDQLLVTREGSCCTEGRVRFL